MLRVRNGDAPAVSACQDEPWRGQLCSAFCRQGEACEAGDIGGAVADGKFDLAEDGAGFFVELKLPPMARLVRESRAKRLESFSTSSCIASRISERMMMEWLHSVRFRSGSTHTSPT